MRLLLTSLRICIPEHPRVRCQECLDRGSVETARAILQHAVNVFPGKKSLYKALAQLECQHGTPEAVAEVLERGVKYCPQVSSISFPGVGSRLKSRLRHFSCLVSRVSCSTRSRRLFDTEVSEGR